MYGKMGKKQDMKKTAMGMAYMKASKPMKAAKPKKKKEKK